LRSAAGSNETTVQEMAGHCIAGVAGHVESMSYASSASSACEGSAGGKSSHEDCGVSDCPGAETCNVQGRWAAAVGCWGGTVDGRIRVGG
jgi:hypothetical protein